MNKFNKKWRRNMNKNIDKLLQELTLEEKAALCSGYGFWETTPIKRLGIPSVVMTDGPHGVRKEQEQSKFGNVFMPAYPSTCFPPAVTAAATWDRKNVYAVGEALGREAKALKVSTLLGPGINIKRSPLCGRNFEYFAEDPYLAGELGVAYVDGVQSTGTGTSLKHYAVNSQEFRRMNSSSEIDDRTLREIYLSAFEAVVKRAQPQTIMCSYNRLNGVHASQNKYLLHDILKEEWGFKGIVVSDWGAVDNRVEGIKAGLHLEMPTSDGVRDKDIVDAVNNGTLEMEALDAIVKEILEYVFDAAEKIEQNVQEVDFEKHHALARKVAADGAVLLKNEGDILPINKDANIAVVGMLAKVLRSQGSGSSRLNPIKEISFTDHLDSIGAKYDYADGYILKDDSTTDKLIAKAGEVAKGKDYVLAFIGLTDAFESESFDRDHLNIPDSHLRMLEEVKKYNDNIIVILTGGSPSVMPYINDVKAILNVYLGGQAGGEATYDLVFGDVVPSGKLPETFPLSIEDTIVNKYYEKENAEYRESIYVGYRYYDTAKKDVLFPFGYGLSYTKFSYSNLELSAKEITDKDTLTVSFDVTNVGKVAGAEVAQLYVKDSESTIFVAEKELKAFDKVYLEPGETKKVTLTLDKRAFAFYNVIAKDWTVESGEFEILVGASSRDILLSDKVTVTADAVEIADLRETLPSYYNLGEDIPKAEFEALLGREVKEFQMPKKGEVDENTCVGQFETTLLAKIIRKASGTAAVMFLPPKSPMSQIKMVKAGGLDMPIRNLYAMSNGAVPRDSIRGLVTLLNGKTFKGIGQIIGGFLKPRTHKRKMF